MSWQEELQQLDNELAQGRVTAEDYRQRRDQLLSLAQQGGQQEQQAPAQQQNSPFAAPFRWQPPAGQSPAETTQVIRPISDQQPPPADSADRTQVVPGAGQQVPQGERTQVVPNVGGYQQGPQTPPPWAAQQAPQPQQSGDFTAPWSNNDLPPDFGKASWPRQGPEVFDSSGGGGNRGKIIAIVVAVVVVLGLAGGIYFFTTSGSKPEANPDQGASTTQAAPTTSTGPQLPKGPFVPMQGTIGLNATVTIDAAVLAKIPTESEGPFLKSKGVTQVAAVTAVKDGTTTGVWAFTPGQGSDPKALLDSIDEVFVKANYKDVPGAPAGTRARFLTDPNGTAYRAHYIANGVVIRVEAFGKDATAAERAFRDLLSAETAKYPVAQ
ncbi:hypothetical protein [Kutzneria albida]|uniref:SHOCT domain-containing protein n=1 Tax=Kutzneria albida DSM 43870 TaxID=1449976 RepID=W5W5G2_9PSEU|nr:hypothetical protein [Kutzneria albida]AHH93449.1 hypothetical protein KALB_72 [Kutzneria albida DSM 43870]